MKQIAPIVDSIMGIFWFIEKGYKPTTILFITIIFGIVGSLIGMISNLITVIV